MSDAGFDVAMADDSDDERGADEGALEGSASSDDETTDAEKASGETAFEEAFEKAVEEGSEEEPEEKKREINVVYVADVDLLISTFLRIRARPDEDEVISWNFENVTFLLNIIDLLSGDDDYVEIRKRKPWRSTLKIVEYREQEAREREFDELNKLRKEFAAEIEKIKEENKEEIEKAEKAKETLEDIMKRSLKMMGDMVVLDVAPSDRLKFRQAQQDVERVEKKLNRRLAVETEKMERKEDDKIDEINRDVELQIAKIKNVYKFLAVALPPIPPLLVGVIVFVRRRLREREGIAKSRMR